MASSRRSHYRAEEGDYTAVTFANGTSIRRDQHRRLLDLQRLQPLPPELPPEVLAATSTSLSPASPRRSMSSSRAGHQVDAFTGGPVITSFTTYPNYSGFSSGTPSSTIRQFVGGMGSGTRRRPSSGRVRKARASSTASTRRWGAGSGSVAPGNFPNLFAGFASNGLTRSPAPSRRRC